MATETDQIHTERRRHRRFVMEFSLRYKLSSGQTGTGEVVNMSSGGLLFRGKQRLPLGELIEADLTWPFPLESGQSLELRVYGLVVRSSASGTAISISKHEFRTVGELAG